jgi:deaminated glutathione amidase
MRVAVCQMNAGGDDVEANVARAVRLLHEAADGGADIAGLPELFTFHGSPSRSREVAQAIPGPWTDRLSEVARSRSMWILGGSFPEVADGHVHNTATLFDRDGQLVARYRKIHLFDVDIPGEAAFRESALFTPGTELVTHETDMGRVGLSICYDLRFPELYRGLVALGAEVLAVPSAFTFVTGDAHWEVLLRARAIEDQCFVVAPAQWGAWGDPHEDRRCFGTSMVVDPWGRVLTRAPADGDAVCFAEIDLAELRRVRQALPALQHRRLGLVC